MKKRIGILVLVAIIVLPVISIFTVYRVCLQSSDAISQTLLSKNTSNTILLEFSREQTQSDLNWLSDRIFKYNDKIFTVLGVKYAGEKILYSCIEDNNNKILYSNLNILFSSKPINDTKTNTLSFLDSFLKTLFVQSNKYVFSDLFISLKEIDMFYQNSYTNICLTKLYIPPIEVN